MASLAGIHSIFVVRVARPATSHTCCWRQGGVGRIAEELAAGLEERGGVIEYRANVKEIITEGAGDAVRAVGVRLNDGRVIR